ncbi:hypothetical protein [Mycobacterium basiliense]|uniref:hypothetical protein n=1 Tax=Mycobacterium basiliense TaxID=2094119 RepID=UPI0039EF9CED
MKAGTGRDIEDVLFVARAQHIDKEPPLGLGASIPVDQLVPFLDETHDIFSTI